MFECSCYLVLKENGIATFGIESYAECHTYYCYAERYYVGCHYAELLGDLKMG